MHSRRQGPRVDPRAAPAERTNGAWGRMDSLASVEPWGCSAVASPAGSTLESLPGLCSEGIARGVRRDVHSVHSFGAHPLAAYSPASAAQETASPCFRSASPCHAAYRLPAAPSMREVEPLPDSCRAASAAFRTSAGSETSVSPPGFRLLKSCLKASCPASQSPASARSSATVRFCPWFQ